MKESVVMEKLLNAGEAILGGVEVHVKFTRFRGDPGIMLDMTPPAGPDGSVQGIDDINARLAGLCRATVMTMDDDARLRLLELVEKDGGNDRMLYRLIVTARASADGDDTTIVADQLDPAFAALDTGAAGRALVCRQQIEQLLATAEAGREEQWKSEEVFEVLGKSGSLPTVQNYTEEEARQKMLEGEEFMLLEVQAIGITGNDHGRESFGLDFIAAMSEKALSSAWMKEKILQISKACEITVMGIDRRTSRHLSGIIRKTKTREMCLYRISVWCSIQEDGSPLYSIRDQIDPEFSKTDPDSGKRAEEARRLAGLVMAGEI